MKIKSFTSICLSSLLIVGMFFNSAAYAEEMTCHTSNGTNSGDTSSTEQAESMIATYTEQEHLAQEETQPISGRFINERSINMTNKADELVEEFQNAYEANEPTYSYDEILSMNASDFNISSEDFERIQNSISNMKTEFEKLYQEFVQLGETEHPLAQNLKDLTQLEVPASMIYVDHTNDSSYDGKISGGGWPYCLDDNGWGYQNFISSDCFYVIALYSSLGFAIGTGALITGSLVCIRDSTIGKINPNLRYCKAYTRNCSPLIGHSIYNHSH